MSSRRTKKYGSQSSQPRGKKSRGGSSKKSATTANNKRKAAQKKKTLAEFVNHIKANQPADSTDGRRR